jgi:hypothetical protein
MRGTKLLIPLLAVCVAVLCSASFVHSEQYLLNGKPLNLFGYLSQSAQFSVNSKPYYDTARDLQAAQTSLFMEGDYSPQNNLRFYLSGMYSMDWVYDIKSNNNEWNSQLFSQSRTKGLYNHKGMYMDNEYWQLLKEAHVTWGPGDFNFRLGKQIVVWGETDGFRLMDQINPIDQRRGFGDVEFENTIIPIWLLKAEYYPKMELGWLQDLGFELTLNPNVTFIPDQTIQPGNDISGIWAPNARIDNPKVPGGEIHIGSADRNFVDRPYAFSSKGFEYAFRVKAVAWDTILTLNGFYGLFNSPTVWNMPLAPRMQMASDGELLLHPNFQGRYDIQRFVGGTMSRDIPFLKSSALGGVAPVVRLEALYMFGNHLANTATTNAGMLDKVDEIRWAIGVDWKIRIPWLNPAQGITIMPQFYQRTIVNYPGGKDLVDHDSQALLDNNNYMTTLMIYTSYLNNKLTPNFFWMQDINRRAYMFRYQVTYDYTDNWQFKVGALFLGGKDHMNNGVMNNSFEFFNHKDNIYTKVTYKWG